MVHAGVERGTQYNMSGEEAMYLAINGRWYVLVRKYGACEAAEPACDAHWGFSEANTGT